MTVTIAARDIAHQERTHLDLGGRQPIRISLHTVAKKVGKNERLWAVYLLIAALCRFVNVAVLSNALRATYLETPRRKSGESKQKMRVPVPAGRRSAQARVM